MIAWKAVALATVAAALASNAWWLYQAVDAGVTNAYQEQVHGEINRKADLLAGLLIASSPHLSSKDVMALARRVAPDSFIVTDSSGVSVDGVGFRFEGDRLVRVD